MAVSLAAVIGPLLGGVLVQLWGWPAVYWIRVPIALVTLALSGLLPSPKPDPRPFDAVGAVMLAACMSALLLALILSQRREVPGLWAVGLLGDGASCRLGPMCAAPGTCPSRSSGPRCSPILPSPYPTS